jgi:ribosomal protein S12 methylthiotransferase
VSLYSILEDGAAPDTISPETPIRSQRPTVGFVSLGCPKNLVDSEVMMGLLHRGGAQLTPRAEDAEILVINTCSFIDSAKQESVDTILEMVQHKVAHGGRAQKLIVAGCLVERYRDEIRKNIPEVDAVVGTGELEAILEAAGLHQPAADSPFTILTSTQISRAASSVNQHSRPESTGAQIQHEVGFEGDGLQPVHQAPNNERGYSPGGIATSRPEGDARERTGRFSRETWDGATAALPSYLYSDETPRILTTPRDSAYIKIAEGCDHPCSEITLIGQDTTCYGEDLPQDQTTGKRPELADVLDALAPLPGLKWLRFMYAYPNKVTTRLLEAIAAHDTVAKYLDVPLQHASANVLRRMKRGGSADRFLQIIDKARATVPGLVLRTSFIVGFPGETEADFEELCAFVQAAKFDWLGVFSYSDEEGAEAFNAAPETKVPKRTIEARRRKLMRLQNKISTRAKKQWIGRELDILVEGESEETELLWQGRSLDQAPEVDGKVLINDFGPHDQLVPGTFYRAEITESHDYDVVARILE